MVQIPTFTSITLLDPPGGRQGRSDQPSTDGETKALKLPRQVVVELVPDPGSPLLDQSFVAIYGQGTVAYTEKG